LANANRLFKSAFQISPAALAITCASTGRYIDVNDSWLKLYGFSREEVIGKTSKELNIFLENYADRETAVSLIIKQGSVHNREINTNTKTGKLLHVLYSAEIVRVENETFILSSTIDVTERKKAEKFLKESEERFSKAFGSSPAVLTITCAEDNKLVDVNETFLKLTEYSREEVIGRTTRELNLFLDPDKRDRLFAIALKGGGLRNQELVARTKSGKLLNVLFSLESIDIAGQKHVLATIIDITELKKAESVLKESEQLYRTLFENTEDGFQLFKPLYNKDGKPNDLLILKVNKAYERQTGLRAADVVGKTVKDFIPNIEPYWITTYCNVATTGKSVHIENYNQSTDRWYDVYAFLYAKEQVGTLFRDITDRKKAEDALHQSEERFFKAFDSNPAAMTITHLPDGLWVDVNGSFLRLTEYTREEIVGHSSAELHLFVGTCDERAKIIRLIRKQGKVDSLETKARTKTGKPLNLLLSAVKTVLNGQEYAITTQIDLTERKKAEEALQKNELKFRTVADYTYDWEYWIAPDGKLLYVSPSCQRITGFSSYEFINDPHLLRKIIHPNDKEFERHFETIESAGEYNKTFRIITREGKVRWIEHLCQPVLHDGKFSGRRASNRDATDRIMREEAVKRQASLIDLSPNAIIVRAFDGTISFWNKGAEKLYGWTKGEATGKIIHNLLQTVFPKPLKKIEHEIEKNQSWAGNLIHKTKDGKSIEVKSHWLVESSTINEHKNVLETNVDLTDLRRVEAELRDKDRLAAIGATAGMVGHDIRNPLQAVLSDTF
jgi:PAS domain S-box-containing protein